MGEREEQEPAWLPTLPRLFDLWRLFLEHTNSEELVQQLVQKLGETISVNRVSLMLLDETERVLTIRTAVGLPPEVVTDTRIELGAGIAGWVALTGQALLLPEGPGIPVSLREVMVRKEITSALCVPLQAEGRVIGVLSLARLNRRPRFTSRHLTFVSLLAERAAIAIRLTRVCSELAARDQFVNHLVESIPSSLLVVDRALRIVSANRSFLNRVRRNPRLTIGRNIGDILPHALLKHTKLERIIEKVFSTGRSTAGGKLAYRAPGLLARHYSCWLFPIKGQKTVENVALLIDDITRQERLQDGVRRAEHHLASVVECSTNLVVSMSMGGRITSWNRAAAAVSRFAAGVVKGRLLSSLCAEDHRQVMDSLVQQTARGKKIQNTELTLLTQRGDKVPIDWSCAPVRNHHGKVTGVVAVGRDLTEYRRMEAELIKSSKMVSLGMMASGIAHELRNYLGIISATAQLFDDRPNHKQLSAEALQKIHGVVQRASLTIENLLRFARTSERWVNVDVNVLIGETLTLLAPQMTRQAVDVKVELQPGLPIIQADQNLLQLVFTNLLLNACKAMPQGGVLTMATRAHPSGDVEIRFTDTGHGIRQEHLPRVFDPFFTTMPAGQGTGLGLSIAYAIIQQHQGSIEVESEVGKGTTFTVRLPCASRSQLPGDVGSSRPGPSARTGDALSKCDDESTHSPGR